MMSLSFRPEMKGLIVMIYITGFEIVKLTSLSFSHRIMVIKNPTEEIRLECQVFWSQTFSFFITYIFVLFKHNAFCVK